MQNGSAPQFIARDASDSGTSERAPFLGLPLCTKVQDFATKARAEIIFDAFVSAVGRLEGLLDKETAMLIERQPIVLDDFNHKKRHGLVELSRAMDAVRGVDRDCPGRDPKAVLARLRVKLQSNLTILKTHLDAVSSIAAVISRVIQEHDSDGTYTQELGDNGRSR